MACFDAAPTRTEPAPIEVEKPFRSPPRTLIDRSIAELLSARGLDVASLGQSDRVDAIRHLNGNGVFMLKGAVACAATALGISEPSVYRYLQKSPQGGLTSKMKRGSTSDSSPDKRPCSSHALQGLFCMSCLVVANA